MPTWAIWLVTIVSLLTGGSSGYGIWYYISVRTKNKIQKQIQEEILKYEKEEKEKDREQQLKIQEKLIELEKFKQEQQTTRLNLILNNQLQENKAIFNEKHNIATQKLKILRKRSTGKKIK